VDVDERIDVLLVQFVGKDESCDQESKFNVFLGMNEGILEIISKFQNDQLEHPFQALLYTIASYNDIFTERCCVCQLILCQSLSKWNLCPPTHRLASDKEIFAIHKCCKGQ
jgi:hypothetical protein